MGYAVIAVNHAGVKRIYEYDDLESATAKFNNCKYFQHITRVRLVRLDILDLYPK